MQLEVVYTTDDTGMSPDKTIIIEFKEKTTLYCYHDKRLNIDRLKELVADYLLLEGYERIHLHIWKIYSI